MRLQVLVEPVPHLFGGLRPVCRWATPMGVEGVALHGEDQEEEKDDAEELEHIGYRRPRLRLKAMGQDREIKKTDSLSLPGNEGARDQFKPSSLPREQKRISSARGDLKVSTKAQGMLG